MFNHSNIIYFAIATAIAIAFFIKYSVKGKSIILTMNALSLAFSGYCVHYGYVENNFYAYAVSILIFIATTHKLYQKI